MPKSPIFRTLIIPILNNVRRFRTEVMRWFSKWVWRIFALMCT